MPDRSVDVHVHFDESNSRFLDQLLKLSLQAESHGVCAHALLLTGSGPRRGETASNANHPLRLRGPTRWLRSEEHTSELQSRFDLVCRLLLEKKNDVARRLADPATASAVSDHPKQPRLD